ncbi:MAG: gliding motility-associated C-terminal domain-containing protein, partial [Brumimicrobium sp.]
AVDTIACVGDFVLLHAEGSGGSSEYIFTWEYNGNVIGNSDSIYVTPSDDNAEYCVTLTEQCGSPSTEECMTITYPEDIDPLISPDVTGACVPVEVNFENVTETNEVIDYTVWGYDDGDMDTVQGGSSASHSFGVGKYDITVEIVTERGCKYKRTFYNLIQGYSYPKAAFYVNPNPTTVYEPEVDAFSQTDDDIVTYEWFAEGATPNYSSESSPTFLYPEEVDNYPLILVVENEYGCRDTVERLVRIINDVLLFAPNTFTPDGDGFNEKWRVYIQGIDIYNFKLEIFNRWGEKVFESNDAEKGWDGYYGDQPVKDGTYIWKIRARDGENDSKYEWSGHVSVIR